MIASALLLKVGQLDGRRRTEAKLPRRHEKEEYNEQEKTSSVRSTWNNEEWMFRTCFPGWTWLNVQEATGYFVAKKNMGTWAHIETKVKKCQAREKPLLGSGSRHVERIRPSAPLKREGLETQARDLFYGCCQAPLFVGQRDLTGCKCKVGGSAWLPVSLSLGDIGYTREGGIDGTSRECSASGKLDESGVGECLDSGVSLSLEHTKTYTATGNCRIDHRVRTGNGNDNGKRSTAPEKLGTSSSPLDFAGLSLRTTSLTPNRKHNLHAGAARYQVLQPRPCKQAALSVRPCQHYGNIDPSQNETINCFEAEADFSRVGGL
ncbi:hypothetical protein V8F20_010354 [Naviculisporaceae sp. PSN 640]